MAEALRYFPEDDAKAFSRCKQIRDALIMTNSQQHTAASTDESMSEIEVEFVILVTHGFFVQKVPTLFGGQGGYADYCSCSCVKVVQPDEGEP